MKLLHGILLLICLLFASSSYACGDGYDKADEDDITDYSVKYLLANYTPCGGHWWAKHYKCNGDTL